MFEQGNDLVIYTKGKYYLLSMHVPVYYDLQMRQSNLTFSITFRPPQSQQSSFIHDQLFDL